MLLVVCVENGHVTPSGFEYNGGLVNLTSRCIKRIADWLDLLTVLVDLWEALTSSKINIFIFGRKYDNSIGFLRQK